MANGIRCRNVKNNTSKVAEEDILFLKNFSLLDSRDQKIILNIINSMLLNKGDEAH